MVREFSCMKAIAPNAAIPTVERAIKSPRLDMTTSVQGRVRMGLGRARIAITGLPVQGSTRRRSSLDPSSLRTFGLLSSSGVGAVVVARMVLPLNLNESFVRFDWARRLSVLSVARRSVHARRLPRQPCS